MKGKTALREAPRTEASASDAEETRFDEESNKPKKKTAKDRFVQQSGVYLLFLEFLRSGYLSTSKKILDFF